MMSNYKFVEIANFDLYLYGQLDKTVGLEKERYIFSLRSIVAVVAFTSD